MTLQIFDTTHIPLRLLAFLDCSYINAYSPTVTGVDLGSSPILITKGSKYDA